MKIIVQRSKASSVSVDSKIVGKINEGLVLLVGFANISDKDHIDYMVKKILNLRIFDDENGVMNKSLLDIGGSVLSISQFTLYADASKGNRPSYIKALSGELAKPLYDEFNNKLSEFVDVQMGVFGADMLINIENDGPVTIILER